MIINFEGLIYHKIISYIPNRHHKSKNPEILEHLLNLLLQLFH